MKKTTPFIAAIAGAVLLVLQQYLGQPNVDFKVVLFAVLIAVLGAVSTILKGRGASFWGIVGTVGFTFYDMWKSEHFTWDQFIITALIAGIMVAVPTAVPQVQGKEE